MTLLKIYRHKRISKIYQHSEKLVLLQENKNYDIFLSHRDQWSVYYGRPM